MRVSMASGLALLLSLGCGGGSQGGDDAAGGDSDGGSGSDGGGDGSTPGEWTTLITGDWTMPAGDEGYVCVKKTVTETLFLTAFRPIIPSGTHHTVLTVGDPDGADGTYPCGVATNAARMIYGSGVGTNELDLPTGVGMRIDAGQQLNLNLHLYNFDDQNPISGTSGTEVQVAASVPNEAEVLLAGPLFFSVDSTNTVIQGDCTMNGDVTIFATGPHMHQLGSHMRVMAADTMIMDRDYTFDDQTIDPIDPIQLQNGEQLHVECTYHDPGAGITVNAGDSTDEEMCFASIFRYPVRGGFLCVN